MKDTATEQLQQKSSELLSTMIDVTIKGVSDVIEFGKQQIPDIIHQLLMWKMSEAIIYVIVYSIFVIGLCFFIKKCLSKSWLENSEYASVIGAVFGSIAAVVILTRIVANILTVINIIIAPKIYLIMFAKDLIK